MTETVAIRTTFNRNSTIGQVDFTDLKFGKIFTDHMFVADYRDGQWQDMRVEPYGDLSLSPATSAIHYGQAIFEGLKAYRADDGQVSIFRPDKNMRRLQLSSQRMCMPEVPEDIFMAGLMHLVSIDQKWVPSTQGSSLYIRPFVFATDGFVGVRPSETYRFIIFCCPVGVYYQERVRVKVERDYTRAAHGGTGAAKSAGNYGGAMYPSKRAQDEGYHQIIWTDANEHNYLEEAGTMNVAFIMDDVLVTPALSDTILDGVTRDSILTLARDMGMKVEERRISVDELIEGSKSGRLSDGFGMGTAATFAPMALINVDGTDYTLPPSSERALSLRKALEDIRTGRTEDKHGWMMKVLD